MLRHVELDASTARRARSLGEAGEQLAEALLARAGFTNLRNLNHEKANFPYGDFYAERSGGRFVISVKMRNKYEAGSGRLNSRYKLGAKCHELAERAEKQLGAKAAWLAISLEPKVLSAYFGRLDALGGNRGILMTPQALGRYECLADSEAHTLDHEALKNVYEAREMKHHAPVAVQRSRLVRGEVKDLGLLDLLRLAGFEPQPGDRIVRHQHRKYPVSELLAQNLLEVYQAYQSKPVFASAERVVSLSGLEGTRACLFGVYRKRGSRGPKDRPPLTSSAWEKEWRDSSTVFYELERLSGFEHLEGRVIVEWGRGALAWCQRLSNKPVLEVTAPGRSLPPFSDYLEFSITHDQLLALYRNEEAHREWRSRLSAVAGVYLILAETTGQLYVGSASGAEGIWGRWRAYAKTGHGGNELLRALIGSDASYPKGFRFSVLQIVPKSMSREDVIEREGRFKAKLGCLAHGLNLN